VLVLLGVSLPSFAVNLVQLDLNGDKVINGKDIFMLRGCINQLASCNPQADFNSDGLINLLDYRSIVAAYGSTVPDISVSISGEDKVFIAENTAFNTLYNVIINNESGTEYTVGFSSSSTCNSVPDSNNATSLFPANVANTGTLIVNETINAATTIEQCELSKEVFITELGLSASHSVVVNIVPTSGNPILATPGAQPSGVAPNTPTDVVFTLSVAGTSAIPQSIQVRKVDSNDADLGLLADLKDDGQAPDGVAGDYVFTGSSTVEGTTLGQIKYKVTADFAGLGVFNSSAAILTVTDLPIGLSSEEITLADIVVDPLLNETVVLGQILVQLVDDVTPEQANTAIDSVGFSVLGFEPALNTMLIGYPKTLALNEAMSYLEMLGVFSSVSANGVDVVSEFIPNDPSYSSQWGFPKTRTDEAWIIARGASVLVGVVDTGADMDHPDLAANISQGYDAIDGDTTPEAVNRHGTHVAGTIAALTNNSTQVSGMAPEAKLIIIRTLGPGGGSHAQFADGVKRAADLGVKIINYSGGGSDSTTKSNAVNYAVNKGVLFIAAAGNDSTSSTTSAFPAAYSNVMAIGSTTSTDGRSSFSNFGTWVTMAAPGSNILSLDLAGGTTILDGTSMATPHVAGAAALVWSAHPTLTASQVQERLVKSAKPLNATLQLGAGRLDTFNAVFNGNFEMGALEGWKKSGTASSVTMLGPLSPPLGARMAIASTGPGGDGVETELYQDFNVQSDVSSIPVQLTYNFISEEYPEYVGTEFDDCVNVVVQAPDGSTYVVAAESINSSIFTPIAGIDFPGGDNTSGQTGWKTAAVDVPVTAGLGKYRVFIADAGDDIYDSIMLLDDIRFKASVTTSSAISSTCN
jgi:hypothetical protein